MSMLGAVPLHAGLSDDLEELRRRCLVVKPSKTRPETAAARAVVASHRPKFISKIDPDNASEQGARKLALRVPIRGSLLFPRFLMSN